MWYLNFGSTTYACGLFSGFSEIDISSRLSHDLISQALATCFFVLFCLLMVLHLQYFCVSGYLFPPLGFLMVHCTQLYCEGQV